MKLQITKHKCTVVVSLPQEWQVVTVINYDNNDNILYYIKVFHPPTNAQENFLKTVLKFTSKQLRHVLVKSHHHQRVHNALPDDGVIAPKHVRAGFNVNFNIVFKAMFLCISWWI